MDNDTFETLPRGHAVKYAFTVNGVDYHTNDPLMDGRQLRQAADCTPPSDYVLILLTRPGTRSVGLDEELSLSDGRRIEFRAFLSDRTFNFTIDERGYEWGASLITEEELRDISATPPGKVLLLEHEDEADTVIEPGSTVDLARRGTEHIHTGKRLVTVYYKDDPFELERRRYTGEELSTKFGVPADYQLDLVTPNGFKEIGAAETVKVREGMHFVSHPPCGQSS